ncbi:suppressor of fused domain protein [Corynebacterium atypicum]|uniref:suppressor of fused domain protein n=1 Tax=Corynebacterium atypicum TaxID=191610 RepID=UPI00068975F5|nr:suppressor of fused domain protein [Corynebacterium atypicum]
MDQQQTLQWFEGLLPVPLKVARGGDFHIGVAEVSGHAVACTTDFADVETGLALENNPETDVRVELLALAATTRHPDAGGFSAGSRHGGAGSHNGYHAFNGYSAGDWGSGWGDGPVAATANPGFIRQQNIAAAVRTVGTAAEELARGGLSAQPGTLLTGLAVRAGLSLDLTVRHGLLASPTVWQGKVPRVTEEPGEVGGAQAAPDRGRVTVVLQVLMLTSEEYALARVRGVDQLMEFWEDHEVDPGDWARVSPRTGPRSGRR